MKKRLKITPVLITLNILIILVIISFYVTRMYKFYKEENYVDTNNSQVTIYDQIVKTQNYVDLTKGLVYDEENNVYRYKGKIDNNYLYYSGVMYRIVELDNYNNVKLITDDVVTLIYSGLDKEYNKSFVNKWLNKTEEEHSGIYEHNIYNTDLLATTSMCLDIIDELTKITCKSVNTDNKISILSLYDYSYAGGKQSYLNTGESFYLSTLNSNKQEYYVSSTGDIGLNEDKILGVRPVITIKGDTEYIKGKGTKDNPYIVEEHKVENINNAYIGSYISLNNITYKIIDINEDKIKVSTIEALKDTENNLIEKTFSNKSNLYSIDKNTLGYYLNNDYYKTLNKDLIVKSDFYIGSYTNTNKDYTLTYNKKINTYVGLISLADMYVNEVENVFTMNPSYETSLTLYTINNKKNAFKDLVTSKYNVRPTFYIKKDIEVLNGEGTKDSPYILKEV